MILLDPPVWAAHGRVWSHLVSDTSLWELRAFARAAGVPDRGFDLDHYDVPAERHAELRAAGATAVDGRTLARRLTASGLRVAGHERAPAKRDALHRRWRSLWADAPERGEASASSDPFDAAAHDLIERWAQPHRVYHGRLHLAATLDALDALLASAHAARGVGPAQARTARLALWFHDAVHDGVAGRDEERSADLARRLLAPGVEAGRLTPAEHDDVARLVLLTAAHDPAPGDTLGALVSDADLAILAAAPDRYTRYTQQVRAEYADVPEAQFREGRAAVLDQLLGLPTLFRTDAARAVWAPRAGANLRAELAALRARPA